MPPGMTVQPWPTTQVTVVATMSCSLSVIVTSALLNKTWFGGGVPSKVTVLPPNSVPEIVSAPKLDVPVTTGGRGTTSLKLALDCTALAMTCSGTNGTMPVAVGGGGLRLSASAAVATLASPSEEKL